MIYQLSPIGKAIVNNGRFGIEIDQKYRMAIEGLEGFSHIQVIWWFSACDNDTSRNRFVLPKPYRTAPDTLGVFSTRTPERPNPIAVSTAYITSIDSENGIIILAWLDAFDGSPVLDIKPYTPSMDRVEVPEVPEWCRHWPRSIETSGDFDWEYEFHFGDSE